MNRSCRRRRRTTNCKMYKILLVADWATKSMTSTPAFSIEQIWMDEKRRRRRNQRKSIRFNHQRRLPSILRPKRGLLVRYTWPNRTRTKIVPARANYRPPRVPPTRWPDDRGRQRAQILRECRESERSSTQSIICDEIHAQ